MSTLSNPLICFGELGKYPVFQGAKTLTLGVIGFYDKSISLWDIPPSLENLTLLVSTDPFTDDGILPADFFPPTIILDFLKHNEESLESGGRLHSLNLGLGPSLTESESFNQDLEPITGHCKLRGIATTANLVGK